MTSLTGASTVSRSAALVGDEIVYVSLQPGTVPNGGFATVRNTRTGASVPVAMVDGGFDPVAIGAQVGDTLSTQIELAGGGSQSFSLVVELKRPPVVVRTDPPPRKRDVPLNANLLAVFSEPVSSNTATSIRLFRQGAPVAGKVTLSADGLRALLQPGGLLEPNSDYVLLIPTDVADLSGDHLSQAVTVQFTTGTAVAQASVATEQAALITNPFNGALRTFNMSAVRWDDGSFSGSFSIFYPGSGARVFGRVSCFSVVAGDTAWIAGVIESANDTSSIGHEYGWRVVDNGPPESGVPDELTLAEPLVEDTLTALEYCARTPRVNQTNGSNPLNPLVSGNIVVNGSGPPPPPPPAVSEIAVAAWPNGGIQVVSADASGGRVLTSDSGDFSPAWSPAGTKIAFDRYNRSKSGRDIYVMNADGSGLKRLTNDGFDDSDPSWSPDGARIAFGRNGVIYVMNATDGSSPLALTSGGCDYHPTWSPDGGRIAFASCRTGTNAIYVMNSTGSGVRRLTSDPAGDWSPWWSPDGTRIVFERGTCCVNAVYLINQDGTGLTRLAVHGRTPSWSPDSRAVVFEWYGLNIVSADGTGLLPLGNGYDPAWSPVGSMPPRPPLAASVTIAPADTTIAVGDSVRLEAIAKDASGNVLPRRIAFWTTSDSTVAVEQAGYGHYRLITGVAPGIAKIAATIDGRSDTTEVTVAGAPLALASVVAGGRHTCAIDTAGQAYCWGSNTNGQLGNAFSTGSSTTPVPTSGGLSFTGLAAGDQHTCGLVSSGVAYCWGGNEFGQLGNSSAGTYSDLPVAVSTAVTFASMSTGGGHTCGLAGSGAAYCWGWNAFGQLGNSSFTNSPTPVPVAGGLSFSMLAAGLYHTCGLTSSGTAYCWGDNEWGQLGNGSTTSSTAPVPVAGALSFVALAAGSLHTCGLTGSGAAYCWGWNGYGQLGDSSITSSAAPVAVASGLTFTALATGNLHSCGITGAGAAYCWGGNSDGQLGDDSTSDSRVPIAVFGGLTFSTLTTHYRHTCALTTTAMVYCWGNNSSGQLGDGSMTNRRVPVKVARQP